jgi:hypothetical protein
MLNKNLQNLLNYNEEEGEFIYINLIVVGENHETILVQNRSEFRKTSQLVKLF